MNSTTCPAVSGAMTSIGTIELEQAEFTAFQRLIYELAGISLSPAKHALVHSRLTKRLRILQLESFADYLRLLENPRSPERENFINALTTNKTEFFREAHHFDFLRSRLFPEIRQRERATGDRRIRIWCAASSSGEEPYSLAMTLMDEFGAESGWDIKVLATDIDTNMLERASAGIYDSLAIDYLPGAYRDRYVTATTDGKYAVAEQLKRLIVYRRLNLTQPPWPIHTRFDAIFCRNVMIYFDQATQHRLVAHMTDLLSPGGYLMIGHSESLIGFPTRLESLGDTIYRTLRSSSKSHSSADALTPIATRSQLHSASNCEPKPQPSKEVSQPSPALFSCCSRQTVDKQKTKGHLHASRDCLPADVRHLIVGEFHASREPCKMSTTLGSCIAACMFDPSSGVAGMNHFMLPESKLDATVSASYGVHAMELLINAMMKQGAQRSQLRAKIFGAANVIAGSQQIWNVGTKNAEFIRRFLTTENIPIDAEYLGGDKGMRIEFDTARYKVSVRLLDNHQAVEALRAQAAACQRAAERLTEATPAGAVTLF